MDTKYHQRLLKKALAAVLAKVSPVTLSESILYDKPLYTLLPREVENLDDFIKVYNTYSFSSPAVTSTGYRFGAHSKNEFAYKMWLKHPVILSEDFEKDWAGVQEILEKIDPEYKKAEKPSFYGLKEFITLFSDKLSGLGSSRNVEINTDHIKDFELVDTLEKHQTEPGRSGRAGADSISEKTIDWLKKFMKMSGVGNPGPRVKEELEALRPDKDVVVYRGKGWNKSELSLLGDNIKSYPFKKGSALTFKYKRPNSWTTNRAVAEGFAQGTGPFWVVLKYTAKPEDVLIDTRKLNEETLTELYYNGFQREIILKPGSYKAEVVSIGFEEDDTLTTGWDENAETWVNLQALCDKVGKPHGFKSGTGSRDNFVGLTRGTESRGTGVTIKQIKDGWHVYFGQWDNRGFREFERLAKSFEKTEELEEYLKSQEFKDAVSSMPVD